MIPAVVVIALIIIIASSFFLSLEVFESRQTTHTETSDKLMSEIKLIEIGDANEKNVLKYAFTEQHGERLSFKTVMTMLSDGNKQLIEHITTALVSYGTEAVS